ncbi:M23 family metallopeptidase [Streptomyces sp. SBT349]|uniref:M23 family metallopeptidase n=1 Tax=Streptomyces sp. SBT349 TaxID=1580539 RepID=UPI000AFBBB50|nr:M23 family metallopeptidase [Streptomyces sp. SBT349]
MSDATTTTSPDAPHAAPPGPAVTRRQRPPRRAPQRRLGRGALGCTLLGALVITGPWTAPAAGRQGEAPAEPGPLWALGPEPFGTGLYDLPFAPLVPGAPGDPFWPAFQAADWTAPVTGHPVSAAYGIPGGWAAGYHTGVDWATPEGTGISSAGPGTVVLAEYAGDYGNAVIVKMTDGYYTLYAHLSEIAVREGQQVEGGTRVGDSGNTGRSTGPHLHFEVREGEEYGTDVDPLAYLARHGVTV